MQITAEKPGAGGGPSGEVAGTRLPRRRTRSGGGLVGQRREPDQGTAVMFVAAGVLVGEPTLDGDGARPRAVGATGADAIPGAVALAPESGRPEPAGLVPVRLTRRGRVVLLALLVILAGLVAALVALPSEAAAPAGPTRVVVVQPGDSLWTIVGRYRPGADPVRAMRELSRANGLPDSTLYPGEELNLPARWPAR